jgi:hypothetical protein
MSATRWPRSSHHRAVPAKAEPLLGLVGAHEIQQATPYQWQTVALGCCLHGKKVAEWCQ